MAGNSSPWVPNYELGLWGQTKNRWIAEGLPVDQVYLGDMFEGEPFFRLDRRAFIRIDCGPIPRFEYQVIEENDRYLIARHEDGVVTKALKEGTVAGTRPCMDNYLEFPVKDRKTWKEVKKRFNPLTPIRYPLWLDKLVKMWQERDYPLCLLGNGSFGLYSQLRRWLGTEALSYLFYDDPALIEEMVEFTAEFLLNLVEKVIIQVQPDYFNFFEDCAGKGGPLFGPEIFRRFFSRPYRRIIDRLTNAGITSFWVDSDGNIDVLIPLWLEVGINCFWPLEQASGMDPRRLRQKFGKAMVLCGGLDKRALSKDKKAIEEELYAKIPPLVEQGGYIPHIDHIIPPDVPYSNFQYYLELKWKLLGRG
ncbi:MAG: hypothetical protein NC911_10880 [Candidatus Omnitrophica bacterium]|nr:hypothetical protein [Candidatus Omnitrophota bacterium]